MTKPLSARTRGHPRAPTRLQRRWTAVVDWLGARKPLDLIAGAVAMIAAVAALSQLA
jgi:hypothetical protein